MAPGAIHRDPTPLAAADLDPRQRSHRRGAEARRPGDSSQPGPSDCSASRDDAARPAINRRATAAAPDESGLIALTASKPDSSGAAG